MTWQKNVDLSLLTTFQIGGPADYFYSAKTPDEILQAANEAKGSGWPIFILAGGSNVLISDEGFRGAVIKIENDDLTIVEENSNFQINCGAGVSLSKLLAETLRAGISGLEWAIGIPGTVGGAIVGNSGAYGHSISENIKEAEVLDLLIIEKRIFSREECQFQYRESIFKKNNTIVLSAILNFPKGDKLGSLELIKGYLAQRKNKIPPYPSAGSVFKNIENDKLSSETLQKIPSEIIKGGKLAAGYLIEQCGLKGTRIGGAEISEQHANFIVNKGGAQARDVLKLIELCKKEVAKKFQVELEEEIRLLGF